MASETCAFCPNPVNPHDEGVYKESVGWVRAKSGDSMVLREDTGRHAHAACIQKQQLGQSPDQEELFSDSSN